MYKKTIKYTDYNDVEREEDFYFNLTEAELTDMQLGIEGGYAAMLERVAKAKDTPALIKIFKEFIELSYGVKSPDGRKFMKSKEIFEDFKMTPAYSQFYMELATDDKEATKFLKNIIPAKLVAKVDELEKNGKISNIPHE
jgi:hypothetical protein